MRQFKFLWALALKQIQTDKRKEIKILFPLVIFVTCPWKWFWSWNPLAFQANDSLIFIQLMVSTGNRIKQSNCAMLCLELCLRSCDLVWGVHRAAICSAQVPGPPRKPGQKWTQMGLKGPGWAETHPLGPWQETVWFEAPGNASPSHKRPALPGLWQEQTCTAHKLSFRQWWLTTLKKSIGPMDLCSDEHCCPQALLF